MTALDTSDPTRLEHARTALAHTVAPRTWRRAFDLGRADATIAPALRVGLATAVVLVAGGLLGYRELAGFAALGALASAFGRYEPYPRLAGKLTLVGAALLVFVAFGGVLGAAALPTAALIGVLSLAAGVAAAYMNAFQLTGPGPVILIFAATGAAGYSSASGDVVSVTVAAAAGVVVGWVAAMLPALVLPLGPARLAAARALVAVGGLERAGTEGVPAARAALARAREVLAASGRSRARHGHGKDLAELLDAADEAIDVWTVDGDPVPLRDIAGHEKELRKLKRASVLGGVGDRPTRRTELPAPTRLVRTARANLSSSALRHTAVRVALASAGAGWVAVACGLEHPLWASMGAMAALQGLNFTHTVQRGIQRLLGNVGGAALAAVLVAASLGYWQAVIAVVLLQIAAELMVLVNYGITTLAVTPMALLLTGFTAPISPEAGMTRILDTLIGVVVGVAVAAVTVSRADRHHLV
ncbi:FUSC family protein [Rhodococcus sp. SGAir0479]|uniref:FUSC family protein n=1 Tax=Rhodococcus sp. SGAir0479 TaxID=2567884 RepID=UPI0010CD252D|nr:FUSC family protein [Rhodococcus sp. SGAir0479]QCQ93206.1 FUSC family protein [Rhodococcus sp. SGAir0479]